MGNRDEIVLAIMSLRGVSRRCDNPVFKTRARLSRLDFQSSLAMTF